MNPNQLIILLVSLIFFIVGLGATAILELQLEPFSLGLHAEGILQLLFNALDLAVLAIGAFLFSLLLFGYLAPVFFLYSGLLLGASLFENPILVIMQAVPLFIAGHIGITAGNYLWQDLTGEDNFFKHYPEIAAMLFAAALSGFFVGLIGAFVPDMETLGSLWRLLIS